MTAFTEDQLTATEYQGRDACVVAGPGSGKTTVLVERYRRLILEHQFEPRQILAITFTEKAAANMKAKLAAQFANDPPRLRELESAYVSTIHGFCVRLLRENAIAAGLDPRFTVLSPRESDNLQWECLNIALDELAENRREAALEMMEALQQPALTGVLKDVYDAIRSAGVTIKQVRNMPSPEDTESFNATRDLRRIVQDWAPRSAVQREEKQRLLEACERFDAAGEMNFDGFLAMRAVLKPNFRRVPDELKAELEPFRELAPLLDRYVAPFRAMIFDVLARFDDEYRIRKATQGRVDFNDLERHSIALLKNNPAVQQKVHKQFRQVMLDEFQDINGQQAELIGLLRSENVFFGVGDRNQSIYGFRHARPEIFRDYHEEVAFRGGQTVSLLHNFRSREVILRCVLEVLKEEAGIDERELISGRNFAGKADPSIEILSVLSSEADDDKAATSAREAAWIAHRVSELRGTLQLGEPGETHAADFRDFALLCRNTDSMPTILSAFDRAGIPYVCGRRQSFLLSREGIDITALLSVISNPSDSISLATLLRGPLVEISDEGLLRIRLLAGGLTAGLNKFAHHPHDAGIPEPDNTRLTKFAENLSRWRADQPVIALDILLARALTDCGVDWTPASTSGGNIESFLQLARTTGATMSLPAFLRELEDLTEAVGAESDLSDEDQGNCVQVMTTHSAKGLEFPVTIIAAMEKGSRRESRPVTFTSEHGLGMRWRDSAGKAGNNGLKDSWSARNKETLSDRERDEENRLLYVAMTRAEEHLILSYSRGKNKAQNWARLLERRFNLGDYSPASETRRVELNGIDVSILVTDSEPPARHRSPNDRSDAEIQRVAKLQNNEQYETTATVTSLAVFGMCPRKYYIQRSLGWNTGRFRRFDPEEINADDSGDEDDLSASRIGSAVHEILAGLPPTDDSPEARRLAEVFTKNDLGKRSANASRSEREWAFIADIDGTIVRGSIDLWFDEGGELHIVDYKTDEVTAESAQAKAREYAPQMALYAIALERALGKRPKSASLHFLRPNMIVEIPLDETAIESARKLIADLRRAQNELRFDLSEGDHCRACQFDRSLCPAGRPDAILDTVRGSNNYIPGN